MNLIFAILLILFIFLSYRKILWGLGAVIVLLPSYLWRFDILGLPSTFLELSILSLFVIWLVKEKKYKQINFSLKSKSYNPVSRPLKYLISLWILVSMLALLINFVSADEVFDIVLEIPQGGEVSLNDMRIDFDNYGVTKYGKSSFVSLIKYNKSIATQFHPEKSGKAGLNLIKYFYDQ